MLRYDHLKEERRKKSRDAKLPIDVCAWIIIATSLLAWFGLIHLGQILF